MVGFLVRRLLGAVVVLFVLSAVVFGLFFLSPADPAQLACGKGCRPEQVAVIAQQMGLDRPAYVQYGEFLGGIFVGRDFSSGPTVDHCPAPCLGFSFQTDEPVVSLLLDRLPVTISITIGSLLLWLAVGVGGGVLSALRRGRAIDRAIMAATLGGMATPVFLLGLLLMMLVCAYLQWLPFPTYVPFTTDPALWFSNLLLPWITIAVAQAAVYTRITRTAILETLAEDHIRTARAYGLSEGRVIGRHGLRSALTPLVTLVALDLGGLLGGAVITEKVYGLPGLGHLLISSVAEIDLPVVVGVTMLAGFFIVVANLVADLLYALVDRRVTFT